MKKQVLHYFALSAFYDSRLVNNERLKMQRLGLDRLVTMWGRRIYRTTSGKQNPNGGLRSKTASIETDASRGCHCRLLYTDGTLLPGAQFTRHDHFHASLKLNIQRS
jgi:hypothetical protein